MDSPWQIAGVTSATALVFYLAITYRRGSRYKLPPGPWALPIFGNLFQLIGGKGVYYKLLGFRERYGDLFRVQMGVQTIFVVFGRRYFHELLVEKGELVSNRPNWVYTPDKLTHGKGIIWSNGKQWLAMQTLLKTAMQDTNVVSALRRHLTAEFEEFQSFVRDGSTTYNLEYLIRQAAFNFLSAFLIGKRSKYDDSTMAEMRDRIESYGFTMATVNIENYIPLLALINKSKIRAAENDEEYVFGILRKVMEENKNSTNDPPQDFLQMYLSKSKDERSKDGMTELDALRTIVDIYVGGRDNLITYTKWILMTFAKYPDVQAKCRSEIFKVIGRDRRVQADDGAKTPYTLAIVKEVLRMRAPVVLAPFHTPKQDIKLGEYDIPKDSIILTDCKAPCHDPNVWKDPYVFNPERFLGGADRQIPETSFVPYGAGPRYCIGRYIGDMFQYAFAANLVQNFQVTTKNPENQISMEDVFDIFGLRPQHFDEVILKPVE
ncbi:cytochrome P450 2J4-like [Ostrea edulis]|uniref:cytochrome P450 2J4-like n=1 Tax=Ostrea edulis TaxID=37623 RepID=UPI0024AE8F1E|nr:cytochrome P450 2J4-like [Ostrea edulis]